ncbi:hypothetical protein [Finegoldia magna]|nr:hypothetical protein [Finegoldia magna]MDU4731771.1 hypothetical protein [Finegoldia magna]
MSNKSNNQGRAYEFAYLNTLHEEISKYRVSKIEKTQVTKLLKRRGIL